MSAFAVLKAAAGYGVVVCLEEEKVKLAAPEKPPQRLLEKLRAHKPEIVKYLQRHSPSDFRTPA
jgi:hypothetical protein